MKLNAEQLVVSRANKEVLRGIDFCVEAGEIYALLGGNGAGKSTTLLSFLGFLTPSSGSITVNGFNVVNNTAKARACLAYLPESASLYEHLNAYENLDYFLKLAKTSVSRAEIDNALSQVALAKTSRTLTLQGYSKGMRQKVAIALAILRNTDILLLDEPTSGLDPLAIDEFHALVRGLADDGKTILMVTHDVYGACQVADRIGLLNAGLLVGEFFAPENGRVDTETVHKAFAEANSASRSSGSAHSVTSV